SDTHSGGDSATGIRWWLARDHRSFLHPLSGIAIFVLDWVLFGSNALSGMLATLPVSLVGFCVGLVAVVVLQRRFTDESWARSVGKGLLGAAVVGAPFPVAGSVFGTWVVVLAGLRGRAPVSRLGRGKRRP